MKCTNINKNIIKNQIIIEKKKQTIKWNETTALYTCIQCGVKWSFHYPLFSWGIIGFLPALLYWEKRSKKYGCAHISVCTVVQIAAFLKKIKWNHLTFAFICWCGISMYWFMWMEPSLIAWYLMMAHHISFDGWWLKVLIFYIKEFDINLSISHQFSNFSWNIY